MKHWPTMLKIDVKKESMGDFQEVIAKLEYQGDKWKYPRGVEESQPSK